MSSVLLCAKTLTDIPLEALQKALPPEIVLRPKVSLKENILTAFSDLAIYVNDHAPLPDARNLITAWTSKNDQYLLQTLAQYQEYFIPEAESELQDYFAKRLKQVSTENASDLWSYYTEISTVFPKNNFWLIHFEHHLLQKNFDWSQLEHQNWIRTTLIPALARPKSTPSTWNGEFLSKLLKLLQTDTNSLLQSKFENEMIQENKNYLFTLGHINKIFEMRDSRLKSFPLHQAQQFLYRYFDFLYKLSFDLEQNPMALNFILNDPIKTPTNIESMILNSLVFSLQKKKSAAYTPKFTDRIKAFTELYPSVLALASRISSHRNEREQLSTALQSTFYLRTLLHLEFHASLPNSNPASPSKGEWLSKNQLQKSPEFRWYESLVSSFNDVLHLTQLNIYKLNLVDKCYRESIDTPTCQSWREKFPMKFKTIQDEQGRKKTHWEVISKTPLTLPPGQIILAPHETLKIVAPEINFNLLTRISAPSGQIEIQTQKINSPWIDVSGQNGFNGFGSRTFPGQKPWIKNSTHCTVRDYLEGVTLDSNHRKTDQSDKINWIGFSIKNPYPKNILVCASDAQAKHRDDVGTLSKIIDLGRPPEIVSGTQPLHGHSGGKISIELTSSSEKNALMIPLLVAMGGDGSQGKDGHDSPLCQRNQYQSFKIVLSHHKQWFQNWIPPIHSERLILESKEEYGDHWYGLFEVHLPRTSGSDGGNAGPGGDVKIHYANPIRPEHKPHRWFLSAGIAGLGGKAGSCGPNPVKDGKNGLSSTPGKLSL